MTSDWHNYDIRHPQVSYPIIRTFIIFVPMRNILGLIFILLASTANAQIQVDAPIINGPDCPITDTIWAAPWGNDANEGSFEQPVRSIARAARLLPFGTEGIRDGHAWGLILLVPGRYEGYQHVSGDWKKGNTYKNISIEGLSYHPQTGIGVVTIGGTPDIPAESHVIRLQGDHVYLKNLRIRCSKGIGVLINPDNGLNRMAHDIRIENIDIDSVGNFGILGANCERIEITGCKVWKSAQYYQGTLTAPCQWPSGLKVMDCKHAKVALCRVAFSRGEGINFHNCLNGEAYNNLSHDNTANFYNDNSKNLMVHANYIFNTMKGQQNYWRGCPQDTGFKKTPPGILIANEGACNGGSLPGPVWDNCRTRCSTPTRYIDNVDSMFIFNNVFQNVGNVISFWEGSTQIIGVNCIRNVFVYNNTSIGTMGDPSFGEALLYFYYPAYNPILNTYGRLENIQIFNNIFSFDASTYSRKKPYRGIFANFHPSANVPDLNGNLWNIKHSDMGTDDSFNTSMPTEITGYLWGGEFDQVRAFRAEDFQQILPCPNHYYFIKKGISGPVKPEKDLNNLPRFNTGSNVGALEYREGCFIESTRQISNIQHLEIYPNPSDQRIHLRSTYPVQSSYSITDLQGRLVEEGLLENGSADISALMPGIYILRSETKDGFTLTGKFIKR